MMDHEHHSHAAAPAEQAHAHGVSLNRLAFTATLHCLSGCAVGEVLGMVIGTLPENTAAGATLRKCSLFPPGWLRIQRA